MLDLYRLNSMLTWKMYQEIFSEGENFLRRSLRYFRIAVFFSFCFKKIVCLQVGFLIIFYLVVVYWQCRLNINILFGNSILKIVECFSLWFFICKFNLVFFRLSFVSIFVLHRYVQVRFLIFSLRLYFSIVPMNFSFNLIIIRGLIEFGD